MFCGTCCTLAAGPRLWHSSCGLQGALQNFHNKHVSITYLLNVRACACAKNILRNHERRSATASPHPQVMSLKAAKESFVSGHGGTTVHEIATVIATLLAGYLVRNILCICIPQAAVITRPSIL